MRIVMSVLAASVLVVSAGVTGCATNPVTGQSQLSLVSESQEIEMGRSQVPAVQQSMGFVADPALQSYVSTIGMKMARASERPQLPWEFHVVDDPMINAFAAPGGFIFVTRGILAVMNSEAELAGVLGHEIAHVTAKHSVAQMSTGLGAQIGVLAAAILTKSDAVAQGAGAVATLFTLKYGRDQETQADAIGHRYALTERYDVREIPKTFMTLQRIGAASGSSSGPSFLSTHPDPGNRVAKTQAWADTVSSYAGLVTDRDEFMTRINGMLYGADPAEGYFENGVFLHPALRFQFNVPSNWLTANQKAAVVLGEPNGQAQIQLSGVPQSSPQAAMQAFQQQQGIQTGNAQNISLGGSPGMIAEFTAATQDGQQIRGQVLMVQHAGTVFQFVGYATAQGWGSQGGTVSSVLRSFRPTASNQVFQRARALRVVTLQRATSIATLAQQSGGAIATAELAILNGVDGDVTLPAGRRVKTVGYR
ncbi:MAG: M48 family metalloprotease [Gemmatimonadales bacterium]